VLLVTGFLLIHLLSVLALVLGVTCDASDSLKPSLVMSPSAVLSIESASSVNVIKVGLSQSHKVY
jgi:hypothetical protein